MNQEMSDNLTAKIVALEALVLALARDTNSVELQSNFASITGDITRSLSQKGDEGVKLAEKILDAEKELARKIPRNV